MSNFKRVLSLVLVVLMIVPMFALPTSATETCSIIINYVYENDYQAAPPFTATVAKGQILREQSQALRFKDMHLMRLIK